MPGVPLVPISMNIILYISKDYFNFLLAGFNAVECGVDIYKFSKDELISVKDKAQISVVHINAPTGL